MIVKVLEIPNKLPNIKLPNTIVKHCNQYKENRLKAASQFAWMSLSKYIDLTKVKFTNNGKPYIVDNSKYFSLSHSFNLVAFIVHDKPVGVDIEGLLPSNITSMFANRILKGKQLQSYFNAKDREIWFTKYWTKYEAYAKLTNVTFDLSVFNCNIKHKVVSKQIKNKGRTFILSYIY